MRLGHLIRLLGPAILAASAAACGDPVHDQLVASLGPETPGVPVGPLHRPGQPCLACHDGTGPAALAFATAGTVYQDASSQDSTPLVAATVQFTDFAMNTFYARTNCAGNFFIEAVDWLNGDPANNIPPVVFPVHIQINYGGQSTQMLSHMAKTTSCAQCHVGVPSPASVPRVYLNSDPMQYPASGCQ